MNLQDAITVLKEKGYKTTGKRKDILEFLHPRMDIVLLRI